MQRDGDIMANWYKSYDNGLDEERLISILAEEPLVLSVWVWMLTQCCKDRSDTFRVTERIKKGVVHKMNLTIDTFDTAMNLLEEIEYISVNDEKVTILQWSNRQSDYCKRSVRTTSDKVPLEKSRGDKRRKYNKGFSEFWNFYPRKQNKGKAYDAWIKMNCDGDKDKIIEAVKTQNATIFRGREMKHIPHGSTWLNGERWDDDTSLASMASKRVENCI